MSWDLVICPRVGAVMAGILTVVMVGGDVGVVMVGRLFAGMTMAKTGPVDVDGGHADQRQK